MLSQNLDLVFDGTGIRIIDRDGEPWFVLADLAKALGHSNAASLAQRLDPDEQHNLKLGSRGGRPHKIVSEPGLYKIIGRSDAAVTPGTFAHRFLRWLTHEVLPSIRKHGSYPPPPEFDLAPAAPEPRKKPRELGTAGERLFAEFKRLFNIDDWRELVPILSGIVSKSRLITIQRGDGVMSALKHDDAWVTLVCAGIDLRYVLNNAWTFTPEERELISNLRALNEHDQALVLHSVARHIGTLATNPAAPALRHHQE
jgi:hypothetical protein